ncbi:borealin isoform X1 [Latimeria chalumnae]|uniref:Borealin n=1 Tax=Latimeria chalumnae TaxID=7897 RepID=M3XJ17_LATCH|nr:PREDICTED: borealin [Latimeria chalumnae]|eukprot:XP_005995627.1 PREDICTED: borealin [Latimeria chalumnae]
MPPAKKKTTRGYLDKVKNEKLVGFLRDFDSEVNLRHGAMKAAVEALLKEVDNRYLIEIAKLPMSFREMNWLDYYALGGSKRAVEEKSKTVLSEAPSLSEIIQTPLKSAKKVKRLKMDCETVLEEKNAMVIEEKSNLSIQKTRKRMVKTSARKVSTSTKRGLLMNNANTSKRLSRKGFKTPACSRAADTSMWGPTPRTTPNFDPRLPKTPAVRTARHREPTWSVSLNGSPLAESNDIAISVPMENGQNIHLMASEIDSTDLARLDRGARQHLYLLSNRLARVVSNMKVKN